MRAIFLVMMALLFVLPIFAQDAETTETPSFPAALWTIIAGGEVQTDCFGITATYDPYEDYDPDALPNLALVPTEDGSLLLVQAGADYLFIPDDAERYLARLIDLEGYLTFEGAMTFTSPDVFEVVGEVTSDPSCTVTGTTLFGRVEGTDVSVWTESDRTFTDLTLFNECIGQSGADAAGSAWATPDLLAALIETDTGLMLDNRAFEGVSGEYVYEDRNESVNLIAYDRITLTGVIDDGLLTVNHFFQINDRSDCQVEYDSVYRRFDSDVEVLLARLPASE